VHRRGDVVLRESRPWSAAVVQLLRHLDSAGPVDALYELAQTAWLNAQLHDDDVAERLGLPDLAARARQLRAIVDGYELRREQRQASSTR
jgi:hypothetical protein